MRLPRSWRLVAAVALFSLPMLACMGGALLTDAEIDTLFQENRAAFACLAEQWKAGARCGCLGAYAEKPMPTALWDEVECSATRTALLDRLGVRSMSDQWGGIEFFLRGGGAMPDDYFYQGIFYWPGGPDARWTQVPALDPYLRSMEPMQYVRPLGGDWYAYYWY